MLTIYVLATQTFYALLILFFIFGFVIFMTFLSHILYQIFLLQTPDLQFYIGINLLQPITRLRFDVNIYLLSQVDLGLMS